MTSCNSRKGGFYLVGMLMIIVAFALMVVVFLVAAEGRERRAKEATLRGNLLSLRTAIQLFEAGCGDYPAKLEDLTLTELDAGTKGGKGVVLDPNGWAKNWPFLETPDGKLPIDPFTGKADWKYEPAKGEIHSSSPFTAINGDFYSDW